MKGRNPTAKEKRYMQKVGEIGCIVCKLFNDVYTPASIHHCEGRTKQDAHMKILPLCGPHHQIPSNDGQWATRHGGGKRCGKKAFEEAYGTESELMDKVMELVGE